MMNLAGKALINYPIELSNKVKLITETYIYSNNKNVTNSIDSRLSFRFLSRAASLDSQDASIESIIRADLTLVKPLTPNLAALEDEITKSISISIHVRRGDYASNPVTTAYHGLYSIDWYQMAIKEMEKSLGRQVHFFIFSDDYDWVKTNLKLDMPCTFIKPSPDGMEAQDLYLMSRCKHNITANSSYSWWAAWLNPNPNKKVIAPAKWFMGADSNTIDLIPPEWIKI
jgi:hypothetical protein